MIALLRLSNLETLREWCGRLTRPLEQTDRAVERLVLGEDPRRIGARPGDRIHDPAAHRSRLSGARLIGAGLAPLLMPTLAELGAKPDGGATGRIPDLWNEEESP